MVVVALAANLDVDLGAARGVTAAIITATALLPDNDRFVGARLGAMAIFHTLVIRM